MTAYAIAHLQSVELGPGIVEYLERIDATLEPYDGRFVVHGGPIEVREPPFDGSVIVIEFPDGERAVRWYESDAYQRILHLRTDNSVGWAILAEGVPASHRATDVLASAGGQS